MKSNTRQFLTVISVGLVALVFILTESHRHFLAWAWPYIEAFWNTYISF